MRRSRLRSEQVNVLNRSALARWTAYFGVSGEELIKAVIAVGVRSERIAAYLGKAQ